VPGRLSAVSAAIVDWPLASERAPRRTWAEGEARRRCARARPMPLFAEEVRGVVGCEGKGTDRR
jgi:hypothetical protein